jgi:predicted RNA-binding protein with PIN domain
VFDGAPDRDFPDGSAFHGVRVAYAEKGSNADARILKMADSSADPRGLTIVTSDRELGVLAGFRGAQVIRSGDFRRLMAQAEQMDRAEEAEPPPIEAVDGWMRYFGVGPDDDEDANKGR